MEIKQFEDKNLAHFSYGIMSDSEKKAVLVDPARNPQQYLDWAKDKGVEIAGIIETHPHADFTSSHLELKNKTGATIYTHSLVGVSYPFTAFDEGDTIELGDIRLRSLHTPGHSPDSISIVLEEKGKQKAVFTGDTLFIGDCGRPDLREGAGNIQSKREDLARQMFHSLRYKLMNLDDDVIVYPAHGAGTLCGKNLSKESSSTIGSEKQTNWSLQESSEDEFVKNLLADQPFVPAYFPYDVELNRKGAPAFSESIAGIKTGSTVNGIENNNLDPGVWIIDARSSRSFRNGHFPHSINLVENGKFETWLGSIIKPGEQFYLAGEDDDQLERLKKRIAAIGYEPMVKEAFVLTQGTEKEKEINMDEFRKGQEHYTIIDVRNTSEVKKSKPFPGSISIPLPELRERVSEIPTDKPVVVHCAGGSRSAAGSSIIRSELNGSTAVYDLGENIKEFNKSE